MLRELSKGKENAQENNNHRPKPSRQPKVQPKQEKSGPTPNIPLLEVGTSVGPVILSRAEGEAGRPYMHRKPHVSIAYNCDDCGGEIYFRVDYLHDTDAHAGDLSRCLRDHKKSSRHKKAMESQDATFAVSLSRAAEAEELAPVERRRALVSRRREAPSAAHVQVPYSQLGSGPPSTSGGSALPTDAGRNFIGGNAVRETPAALQQALPTTDGNFTFQLPDSNLTDAGRYADLAKIPGYVLLTPVASGTSAVVYAAKRRRSRDAVYVLDEQIASASHLGKGALIALRPEACMQVAKESYQNEAEPFRAAKVFNDNEDGAADFADEEAVYAAMLARNVSRDFILGCFGSEMTRTGQVHLALARTPT